jgi:phage baseplate assembly protein W
MSKSFKDVGYKRYDTRKTEFVEKTLLPIGIRTPMSFASDGNGLFNMTYEVPDQVEDNLRNLIQTNFGERLGRYDYGANLRELIFEYSNKSSFEDEVMVRINTAVARWMPFVNLESFDSAPINDSDDEVVSKIALQITYSVPRALVYNKKIEVVIFTI